MIAHDPFGVELRLWQARIARGRRSPNIPGAWNFGDLHTADESAAIDFYTSVFDWDVADLGFARDDPPAGIRR